MVKSSIVAATNCADFFYLYPNDYEFYMDDLIHLWIAQGFFYDEEDAQLCFEEFVDRSKIIESSCVDTSTGRLRYMLNHSSLVSNDYYFRSGSDDTDSYISRNTLHASIRDSIDPSCLTDLYQAENLRTLLILHDYKSRLDQLPRHFFLKLPLLIALQLSHTSIKELPSTIRYLKYLRYLNLSFTPITTLPNSLCTLSNLQTLNLSGCSKLICLPRSMSQLTKLRHLNVDVTCLLVFMPPGFGDLAELQTLSAFIVGKENGCHITELKQMVNLRGTFRILRLENVSSSKEAMQAALEQKKYLNKLELHWSKLQDGFELLENLRPCKEIQELEVLGYGGANFPSWIGEPLFTKLTNITIHDCRNCKVFPPLGQLPSLESLCISDMHAIKVINHHLCGRNMGMESLDSDRLELGTTSEHMSTASMFVTLPSFPTLKNLTINGMTILEEWCGVEEGDFPLLQNLNISNCSKLTSLPKLSYLKLLKKLEISLGPSLQSFSEEGLPTSLQYLVIIDCPLLKEKYLNDEEENWQKLGNIPNIWIDYQQMTKVSSSFNQARNVEVVDASHYSPAPVQAQVDIECQTGLLKQTLTKDYATGFPSTIKGATNIVLDSNLNSVPLQTSDTGAASELAPKLEEQVHVDDTGSQQLVKGDQRGAYFPTVIGKPSEDGYNWRKYDEKQVKGSGYPRSYYTCIHQNCLVKKKVERSHDGQITKIVYKGVHNHPLPQPSCQSARGSTFALSEMLETGEDAGSYVKVEGGSSWRSIPQGSRDNKITSDWIDNCLDSTSSTSVVTDVSDPLSTVQGKQLRIVKSADTPKLSSTLASHGEGSRSSRVVRALSNARLQDGYVSYPWEKKMKEFLPVPNSSCFPSLLLLPKASDRVASRYNDLEDTLARANAWLHASQASGVPIVFLNVQTESLLTKISGETASSTVNAGSLSDLSNLANASLYGFEDYHRVDIGVVRAVRLWYAPMGGETAVEITLREGDTKLGFAISRTEEGFIYISAVIDDDENGVAAMRSGLIDLYIEAAKASKLLVVSRVSNEKVLPWMVSSTGTVRCFDTVSLSQKLSLHRHALKPILIHVFMWDSGLVSQVGSLAMSRSVTPSVMPRPSEIQLPVLGLGMVQYGPKNHWNQDHPTFKASARFRSLGPSIID